MHYDLIIITNYKLDESLLAGFNYLIANDAIVNDNKTITYHGQTFTYDYLIIDKLIDNIKTLRENKRIITNQFFETSIENVYAIGPINNSPLDINSQLKIIVNHLKNPF